MFINRTVSLFVCLLFIICAKVDVKIIEGIGGSQQDWGHITVRPNAHMFWWLYYTTYNDVSNYTERPLIIWLQGGPGTASSGFGNFLEIGPINNTLHKRQGSFIENFNVLFVDAPVGVGYSYFSDEGTKLVTSEKEIGEELYNFLKIFITTHHPEFKNVPVYVFGESYGGKVATQFVHKIKQKEREENVTLCNLRGLALGDAFISPKDYYERYASIALSLGLVDNRSFTLIDNFAKQIQVLLDKKDFDKAVDTYYALITLVHRETNVSMNNFLERRSSTKLTKFQNDIISIIDLMNDQVKSELNIANDITWEIIWKNLTESIKPEILMGVTDKIEMLLNTTDVKIIVYNGILDLLVNTAGTISWMDSLIWEGRERWYNQNQTYFEMEGIIEGYVKKVDKLVFYAILRAGHIVPADNLHVTNEILQLELLD